MATPASRTFKNTAPATIDWERDHFTLARLLNIDLNLRREELKDALLDYEDTHPGNKLVGSKVYEFLRHCQNIVWKQLAELAVSKPAEYELWRSGQRGHWPLETNNVAHGMLLRLSEGRRAQLHEPGAAIERTKSGMPVISDNIRRTVQNWRRKTTAAWVPQSGDTLKGFPFFLSWTRLNRAGEPDPKGRGNVVGLVNMAWIFGPQTLEACMTYMAQQAARRRQTGKSKGREFDSYQGGASAYFASLGTRYDSKALQQEMELAGRSKLKRTIWAYADDIKSGKNSPEMDRIRDAMTEIYYRLHGEPDFRDAVVRDTNAFFQTHLGFEDFIRAFDGHKYVAMAQYVLQYKNAQQ